MRKFAVFYLFLITHTVYSQDLDSLLNLNAFTPETELQKMLNNKTGVGSLKNMAARETPGILSIITSEEIESSGARDLVDVLRMVPGFDISHDLQFILGISLRGSWANEGKVLVLWDGQPINELLYQSVPLGNHFSVEAIHRIEIIRGPGSAMYGGSAEFGVINITTKAAAVQNGVQVYSNVGFTKDELARHNYGVSLAAKGKVNWDMSFFTGKSIISDQQYQDLYQENEIQDLGETTYADPLQFNAGIHLNNLHARILYDRFKTSDPFEFATYDQLYADINYKYQINPKITVVPQIRYSNQVPWAFGSSGEYEFKVRAKRYQMGINSNYDISRKVNVTGGVLYFQDKATDLLYDDYFLGKKSMELSNAAVFVQGLFIHRLFNATVGFRYEKNSRTNAAFVPRIGLTKKIENFHFKLLYSEAFRTPALENFNLAVEEMLPERSRSYELELGYQFTPDMLLSVNSYYNTTKDIIMYMYEQLPDGEFIDGYMNNAKVGTRGLEAAYNFKNKFGFLNLSYSYSEALDDNTTENYQVPFRPDQFLGQLKHKLTLSCLWNIDDRLSLHSSMLYGGNRFAYNAINEEGEAVINELPSYTLLNMFFNYKNLIEGLNAGFGVHDLLDHKPDFAQPYNADYAPVPGRSREMFIKLSYQIDFK